MGKWDRVGWSGLEQGRAGGSKCGAVTARDEVRDHHARDRARDLTRGQETERDVRGGDSPPAAPPPPPPPPALVAPRLTVLTAPVSTVLTTPVSTVLTAPESTVLTAPVSTVLAAPASTVLTAPVSTVLTAPVLTVGAASHVPNHAPQGAQGSGGGASGGHAARDHASASRLVTAGHGLPRLSYG